MKYGNSRKLNIYKEAGTIIYCAAISEVVIFVVARKNLNQTLFT